tara:strand:- start:130 stop:693 length:564 start_codon:yes stop_codon:yes gene_type:complete
MNKPLLLVLLLLLTACATPSEVKQLSIKQMEYFDSAIAAVEKQSAALIMATEKLVIEAKARIDAEEQLAKSRLTTLIQQGGLDQSQATTVATQISDLSSQTTASKNQLDDNLAAISAKTLELNAYLVKMKEVHIAIDSYVQSEKAGEKVVHDVLNQPSVKTMLAQVNELTPKIENGLSDLTTLLNGL